MTPTNCIRKLIFGVEHLWMTASSAMNIYAKRGFHVVTVFALTVTDVTHFKNKLFKKVLPVLH
jgi:hypothetical protein